MLYLKFWLAHRELKATVLVELVEILKFSCSSDNNHLFLLMANNDLLHAHLDEGSDEVTFSKLYHNVRDFACPSHNLYFISVNGRLFESDWSNVQNFREVILQGLSHSSLRSVECFKSPDKTFLCLADDSGRLWLKENDNLNLIEFVRDSDIEISPFCREKAYREMAITTGIDFCVVLLGASSTRFRYNYENSVHLQEILSGECGSLCLHSETCLCDKPDDVVSVNSDVDEDDEPREASERVSTEGAESLTGLKVSKVPEIFRRSNVLAGKSAVHVGQLLLDTEVWACGQNRRGQLGVGDQVPRKNGAVCLRQLRQRGLKHIASGNAHSVALAADGQAWTWGDDSAGQLGSKVMERGSSGSVSSPRAISWPVAMGRLVDAAAGDNHTIFLTDCGTVVTMGKCMSNSTLKTAALDISGLNDDNEEPIQVLASGNFSVCIYSSIPTRKTFPELHTLLKRWRELLSQCHALHSELFPLVPSSPLNKPSVAAGESPSREELDLAVQAVTEGYHRILALVTLTVESLGWVEHHAHLSGESLSLEHVAPISHCSEFVKVYRTYLEAVCDLLAVEGFKDLQHYSTVGVQQVKAFFPGESDERVVSSCLLSPLSHQRHYLDLVQALSQLPERGCCPLEGTAPKALSVPELTAIPPHPSRAAPTMHCSRSETASLCSTGSRGGSDEGTATPPSPSQGSVTLPNGWGQQLGSVALKAWRSMAKGKEWERAQLHAESTREFWEDGGRGGMVLGKWKPMPLLSLTTKTRERCGEVSCPSNSLAGGLLWRPRLPSQRLIRESWVWPPRGWLRGPAPLHRAPSLWVGRPGTLFTSPASASLSPSPSTPSLVLLNDAFLQVAPNGSTTAHALATLWVQPLRDDSWERGHHQIPQNALKMTMPEDSLTVVASSPEEKAKWLKVFNSAIMSCLQKESPALVSTSLATPPTSRNASHHFQRHPLYRNAVYTGGWLLGHPHGKGLLEWLGGQSIEGIFKDGKVNGHATHVDPLIGTYEGQWKDGQYHGHGIMRYANGAVYEGEWKNGVPEGHGIHKEGHFLSSVASVYVGDWVAGCKHGYGVMDDILTGQKYLGMWERGERSGSGLIVSLDGIYHEGTFVRGSIAGHGVMVLEEGTHYEGELRGIGVFGGRGCLTIAPGGHCLEGFLSGSWDGEVKVNGGTFHFKRAPTSPSGDQPQSSNGWPSASSASPTPSSFGRLCVPSSKKWKSLFQHCREELGLTTEEDETDFVVISEVRACGERVVGGGGLGEEAWQRVWENVAVAITRSQLRLKQKLQQCGKEGAITTTRAAKCERGTSSSGDDGLITIPHFGRHSLDKKSYEDIQHYLLKATESRHHPLGCLVSSLASAFNATYGGVRVHPLLLPHAVSELASLTLRLYAICRLLFPALPDHHHELILFSRDATHTKPIGAGGEKPGQSAVEEGEDDEDSVVVTSPGLLHPILMPRLHSSLFVLYALHNKAEDDAYWQQLLKWNRHDNISLMALLEVPRKFWVCASELESPLVPSEDPSSLPPTPTHSCRGHAFVEAVETLQQLKTTFCPTEKLQVIHRTFERIAYTIQGILGVDFKQLGMDDLFPIFHFIVVKAQILQLGSEIHFIEDFLESHLRNGELGMMFTTLKACYYQILQEKVG
ncbi:alsin [Hetaerina americana]|uniref:alsin n=1 Tax=Hetaerina americana TaxID=62018 RepID=UPI003A7F495E